MLTTLSFKRFLKSGKREKGVALFVSILMSMSLAVIAMGSMNRVSEASHLTGSSLQERKLLLYAQSAVNMTIAEVQDRINEEPNPQFQYSVNGGGAGVFKYYPVDISVSGKTTKFGYRARALRFASPGDSPPGLKTGQSLPDNGYCYDIVVDVAEVLNIPDGYPDAPMEVRLSNRYYLGRIKTVGVISCFQKGV
jgi:hypothetical protein